LLDRIHIESLWLGRPAFADELVGCETLEGLEPSPEIVSVDEVGQVASQLFVVVVVDPFYGRLFDRAVHSLDLAVGPWMVDLGERCSMPLSWQRMPNMCLMYVSVGPSA